MMLDQLITYTEKIKFCPYLTPYTKIISKCRRPWKLDLNVKSKTIKILQYNMGKHTQGKETGANLKIGH